MVLDVMQHRPGGFDHVDFHLQDRALQRLLDFGQLPHIALYPVEIVDGHANNYREQRQHRQNFEYKFSLDIHPLFPVDPNRRRQETPY